MRSAPDFKNELQGPENNHKPRKKKHHLPQMRQKFFGS